MHKSSQELPDQCRVSLYIGEVWLEIHQENSPPSFGICNQ